MLGLGETEDEIAECMDDLRAAGVDILTLGQYLRPTLHHLAVAALRGARGIPALPRNGAWQRGFRECVSGPLVRSSYRAEQALAGNNAGLRDGTARPQCHERGTANGAMPRLCTRWLGRVAYEPTWRAMQQFTDQRAMRHAR